MAPELSHVRRMTFVLLALAAAATELAADDHRPVLAALGLASLWVGLAALLGHCVPHPQQGQAKPPLVALLLLLLAAVPFALEPLSRHWFGQGYHLELQMVFALRNVGLGLAAFGSWLLCLRLACIVSLFLILFSVTMTDHPAVVFLLGLYSAADSIWLMLTYWTGLRRFFVRSEQSVAVEAQPDKERLPWLAAFVFVALIASVLSLLAIGPQRAARVLGEWIATSGGTGYDPFARGGVNDGDDEVKGDNANSTGMTQTDSFLDSPLPSLYDLANDLYGEPFKPQDHERSLALGKDVQARESEKPPADNLRPNREFPTTRRSPREPRQSSDRSARAMFEVEGRTPLHVRAAAFDHFDGRSWHEARMKSNTCLLEKERDSRWMVVQERSPQPIYAEADHHRIKVTRSPGTLVPTPPQLVRFRLGRIDQADFFTWSQDRILRMAQRKTPSGIAIETTCRTVDPRLLGDAGFSTGTTGERLHNCQLPKNLHLDVTALARDWTQGEPDGWPQVAAVVRRLRRLRPRPDGARARRLCRFAAALPSRLQKRSRLSVCRGGHPPPPRPRVPGATDQRLLRRSRRLRPAYPAHPDRRGRPALLGRGVARLRRLAGCRSDARLRRVGPKPAPLGTSRRPVDGGPGVGVASRWRTQLHACCPVPALVAQT